MLAVLNAGAPIPPEPTPPAPAPAGAVPQTNSHSAPVIGKEVKVFNIPVGTEENELRAHFASNGEEVTNIRILPIHDEELAFTSGSVAFSSSSQARIAIEEKNNVDF